MLPTTRLPDPTSRKESSKKMAKTLDLHYEVAYNLATSDLKQTIKDERDTVHNNNLRNLNTKVGSISKLWDDIPLSKQGGTLPYRKVHLVRMNN